MNRPMILGFAALVAVALGVGYWWGTANRTHSSDATTSDHASHTAAEQPAAERRILYYRHPMGLPDTSSVPKKDSMGMDYVPVYSDEAPSGPGFVIPTEKLQRLGVRTTEAQSRELARMVRAVGTVQVDERLQAAVSPKFDGYVTRLYVATTGAPVRRGEPMLEVYSPELVSAQEEYLVARRNLAALGSAGPEVHARLSRLVQSSLTRLQNWDVDPRELAAIEKGEVSKNLLIRSPVDGVVLEKTAVVGLRFEAGQTLYQVAGLERVWLQANVFEQDLGALATGRPARASFEAYPDRVFEGKVAFVYPTLEAQTRTLTARIELPNPDRLLKPGLYGTVDIAGPTTQAEVAIPASAVLDSGTRRLVFAAFEGGRFEAREVKLGARSDDYVAVLDGIKAGESVVIDGNFLIDAESNLRAGTQAFSHSHGSGEQPAEQPASRDQPAEQPDTPKQEPTPPTDHAHHDHMRH